MTEFLNKSGMNFDVPDGATKKDLQEALDRIKNTKVNVLLIGGTGVGKSSTINALFHTSGIKTKNKAAVGESANPETMDIREFHLENVVILDTPGFGDSTEKDKQHQNKIIDLLRSKDNTDKPLIDLIFLVLDGTSRDFSSAYKLINDVVAPNLPDGDKNRLLIGINKADKVMHHRFWDHDTNQPKSELIDKLEEQSKIVKERIQQDTGFRPDVVYYAAGETHQGELLQAPYNLGKLLSFIIDHLPHKKRAAMASKINRNSENFDSNDGKEDYQEKLEKSLVDSLVGILSDVISELRSIASEILKRDDVRSTMVLAATALFKSIFSKK